MTINNVGYELNTATVSDVQVDLASNPDTITQTSNGMIDQKYLVTGPSEKSISSPPLMNHKIVVI